MAYISKIFLPVSLQNKLVASGTSEIGTKAGIEGRFPLQSTLYLPTLSFYSSVVLLQLEYQARTRSRVKSLIKPQHSYSDTALFLNGRIEVLCGSKSGCNSSVPLVVYIYWVKILSDIYEQAPSWHTKEHLFN